jgi:signal transduction histidine kinase
LKEKKIKIRKQTEKHNSALQSILSTLIASPPSTAQVTSVLRDIADTTKGNVSVGVYIGPDEWIRLSPADEQANWQPAEKNEADLFNKTVGEKKAVLIRGETDSGSIVAVSAEGQVPIVLMVKGSGNHKLLDSYIDDLKELVIPLSLAVQHAMSLQEAKRSARQTELLLDLLFHDVRNFINTTRTALELLEIDSSNADTREEHIAIALDQTDGVTNLLARVKGIISKKELGELASVNLIEALRESISTVMSQYGEDILEIGLKDELEDGTPFVIADQLLSEVFVNILTNAVKYTEDETKWIDIDWNRWNVNPSFVVISFSDRGKGIPEHLKSKVFGRFALESSTGMGLGLNVILRLVEQYAGYLWFEDRVEGDHSQGTVVNVALRLVDD